MAKTPAYSDDRIIDVLKQARGMVYIAADLLHCEPSTIYRRAQKVKRVNDAIRHETERSLDRAELQLLKQINDGNTTALIFYLKTKGKERGYVERHEFVLQPEDAAKLKAHGLTPMEAIRQLINALDEVDDAVE